MWPHRLRRFPTKLITICGALIIALTLTLSAQRPAAAHGYIVRTIPQDSAVLDHAPTRIQIWFSENLEARFSSLSLSNDKGETFDLTDNGLSSTNLAQLSARLPAVLPDGAYIVMIRAAFASDGHVVNQPLLFWIGSQTGSLTPNQESTRDANLLEIGWRSVALPAFNVLFGVLLLYQVVLLPGWGNTRYKAGGLPPRVMRRLTLLLWVAVILAGTSTIAAVLQQSMSLFVTDLPAVLRDRLWSIVLEGTQIGGVLKLRLLLIAFAAAVQIGATYIAVRSPEFVTALWMVNMIVAGAILGTLSISSHAAGTPLWAFPSVPVDWLHLLANSAWVGGLIGLSVVLPVALTPLGQADRQSALLAVLRRFSPLGIISVGLLITTGLYSALIQIPQAVDLTTTGYGRTLIAKVLLIVPLLLIGLYHHLIVTTGRLKTWAERFHLSERVANLAASLRLESGIGIGVLLIAGVLAASPPPVPPSARANNVPTQTAIVAGLQISLALDPAASGTNSYTVTLSRDGKSLDGAQVNQVRLQFVYPSLDKRSRSLTLDDAGSGTYVNAGPELERSGEWQAWVDVIGPDRQAIRAAFRWSVPDLPPNATIRQATIFNWLSAALIVLMIAVWLKPSAMRLVRKVNPQPQLVVTGLALGVITIGFLVMGGWMLANAARRTDTLRNPPPAVVNPILADMESLTAGRTVYDAKCVSCHGAPDNTLPSTLGPSVTILRDRLPTRRDEELYRVLTNGIGKMPAISLSESECWNVINYLRSSTFTLPDKSAAPTR